MEEIWFSNWKSVISDVTRINFGILDVYEIDKNQVKRLRQLNTIWILMQEIRSVSLHKICGIDSEKNC